MKKIKRKNKKRRRQRRKTKIDVHGFFIILFANLFPSNFFLGKKIFEEPKEKILTNFPFTNPPDQPNIPNKFFISFFPSYKLHPNYDVH